MFNLLVKIMAMCWKQVSHTFFWSLPWQKQPRLWFWDGLRECQRTLISYQNRLEKQIAVGNKSRHSRVGESRLLFILNCCILNLPWYICWWVLSTSFIWTPYASGMSSTDKSQNFDNSHCFMKNLHFFKQRSSGKASKASASRVTINQIHKNCII